MENVGIGAGPSQQAPAHDMTFTQLEPECLILTGHLPAGGYVLEFVTRADAFPVETLMIPLVEWPSLERMDCGPFDFNHTAYGMVVPTFRLHVDGRDCGLVWCEVPAPEDMAARRVRAHAGFRVDFTGEHRIEIIRSPDEQRLDFASIERIWLRPDIRTDQPLDTQRHEPSARPRLFLGEGQLPSLRNGTLDATQRTILDNLRHQLESGHESTYAHRTVTAALVGLVDDDQRWTDHAIDRALQTCDREVWGYHNVPEVMGWNNDRDAGMRLFEVAIVYDWLHDRLSEQQRQRLRERLSYFAAIVARITRIQFGYWYTRSHEAHGHGVWFGLVCASIALLDDDANASEWLAWSHGNICDAMAYTPQDGIVEWSIFNIQWLVMAVLGLERYRGGRLKADDASLRNFARNIMHHDQSAALGLGRHSVLPLLLLAIASSRGDQRAQADGIAQISRAHDQWFHPLTLLAYDPTLQPATPTVPSLAARSENGQFVCRTSDADVQFIFRCGTPLTRRHHEQMTWNAQAWYKPLHAGSFMWTLGGREIVPAIIKGYRPLTRHANIMTIDGAGHPQDARPIGGRTPLDQTPRIHSFHHTGDLTYCSTDMSASYTAACDVQKLRRQWVFLHASGVLVIHDLVEMRQPHLPAWNLHANGLFEQTDDLIRTQHEGQALAVRYGQPADAADAGLTVAMGRTHYVPTYTQGLNRYQTMDWQPEINMERTPPDYGELRIHPGMPVRRFVLITLIGPDREAVRHARWVEHEHGTGFAVPGSATVLWPSTSVPIPGISPTSSASAIVRQSEAHPQRTIWFGVEASRHGLESFIQQGADRQAQVLPNLTRPSES